MQTELSNRGSRKNLSVERGVRVLFDDIRYFFYITTRRDLAMVWDIGAQSDTGGAQVLKMEFRRFSHTLVLLPCQIIRTGRKIVYRLMGYNDWLKDFFATWKRIKLLRTISIGEWSKPV